MKKVILFFTILSAMLCTMVHSQTISGKSNPVKLQYSDAVQVSTAPIIIWINPDKSPMTLEQSQLTLKIGINSKAKIKSVKVLKNNKALTSLGAGEPGSALAAQFTKYIEQDLLLDAGQNEVRVLVENEKGEVVTEAKTITVNGAEADRAPTFAELGINKLPVYHALIIGVSEYKYNGPGLSNLDKPVKDAQALYDVLINKYSFTTETTILLKNPTREEMIDAFDALTRKVQENDNVLIFYAGHGHHEKETGFGFWLPSDAKKESRSAWIANSTIKDYIGAMKSKHTLLITDACFSGSIFKTRRVDYAATALKIHEIYRDKSRKAITSGNLSEVPDESFFIKYLLKTLKDNDQVFLTASTLFSRLYEPVTNNTTTSPQFGVIQGAGDENGDFIFFKKME